MVMGEGMMAGLEESGERGTMATTTMATTMMMTTMTRDGRREGSEMILAGGRGRGRGLAVVQPPLPPPHPPPSPAHQPTPSHSPTLPPSSLCEAPRRAELVLEGILLHGYAHH